MQRRIVLDTGPLVALLAKRDRHHAWAIAQWSQIEPPLLTCEAVLSEAFFLLRHYPLGRIALLGMLRTQGILVSFNLADNIPRVSMLLNQYQSVPMSFADACLVCMAELETGSAVFTLDSDFYIYRKQTDKVIPVITPESSR